MDKPYIVGGVVIAAFMQAIAIVMAGGGEGWVSPIYFSLTMFVLFPTSLKLLSARKSGDLSLNVVLVAIAGMLNFALYRSSLVEGEGYVHRVGSFGVLWILLWFSWQLIVVADLVRGVLYEKNDDYM
jgi:hypothetical protein